MKSAKTYTIPWVYRPFVAIVVLVVIAMACSVGALVCATLTVCSPVIALGWIFNGRIKVTRDK